MSERRFNPGNYIDVQERINRFWTEYPGGAIRTYLISDDRDFTQCRYNAAIFKDRESTSPDATGYAVEAAGGAGANRTSHEENCETSAIGRALANMGYATRREDRPSKQEMTKVNAAPRQQPTPIDKADAQAKPPSPIRPEHSEELRAAEQMGRAKADVNNQHLQSPMTEPPAKPDGVLVRKLHQEAKLRGLGDGDALHANVHKLAVSQGYGGIGVMTDADVNALIRFVMTCPPKTWSEVKQIAGIGEATATAG